MKIFYFDGLDISNSVFNWREIEVIDSLLSLRANHPNNVSLSDKLSLDKSSNIIA